MFNLPCSFSIVKYKEDITMWEDKVLEQLNIIKEKLNELEEAMKRNHELLMSMDPANSLLLFE